MVATTSLFLCAYCRRPIFGYYNRWPDGTLACETCSHTLPQCRVCKRPLLDAGTGTICSSCTTRLPSCARCGTVISGAYWSFEGRSDRYCRTCWEGAPRCSACNLFADDGEQHGDRLFCHSCLQRLPRCGVCSGPLLGRYWSHGDDTMFCDDCEKHRPHCVACNAPVEYNAWEFERTRYLCSRCRPVAVLKQDAAEKLYRDVRARLARSLGIKLHSQPDFKLLTYQQMQKLEIDMDGETHSFVPAGKFVQVGQKRTIYIQRGQRLQTVMAVIAHEIAHAWQSEQCLDPASLTPLLSEGFAEWVAYRILDEVGGQSQQETMRTQNNIYGQGLRHFLAIEKQRGRDGVFTAARGVK